MAWLLLIVGLILLVVGAELVVRAGSALAAKLGIPPILIGLTVVSIGTSAPELAVGIEAALIGAGPLAVGNIAGTNIVNLLLILGLSAAMSPLVIAPQTRRFDLPTMSIVALVVLACAMDLHLSQLEGALLTGIGVVYLFALIRLARREKPDELLRNIPSEKSNETKTARPKTVGSVILRAIVLVAGLVIIIFGAEWLVDGSVELALAWGVSESFIGLTIVAIGTSAPELATAVVSTIRGQRDIAIGNLIGSSTFNLTLILGIPMLVAPMELDTQLVLFDLPLMILATIVTGLLMIQGNILGRRDGLIMVGLYAAYMTYVLTTRL